jgi:hypothetical protein
MNLKPRDKPIPPAGYQGPRAAWASRRVFAHHPQMSHCMWVEMAEFSSHDWVNAGIATNSQAVGFNEGNEVPSRSPGRKALG